jgi:hypothetical protein
VLAKIIVGIVTGWLLLISGLDAGSTLALAEQTSGSQDTHVMQQMDHRRRLSEQERDQARARVAAEQPGVVEVDLGSASADYAVIGILSISGVALYAFCRRRNCWPRRRGRARRPVRPLP